MIYIVWTFLILNIAAIAFVVTIASLSYRRERNREVAQWYEKREAHQQRTADVIQLTEFTRRRALRRMAKRRGVSA